MVPKLAEMEQSWIMFTSLWFHQKSLAIHLRDSHVKFKEKIKSAIPREQNCVTLLVKNGKTVFSKLTQKISLLVSGEQASKHLASSFPFSELKILSSLLGCHFSGISCTFHLGQMFNGFLTSTLDFYWSLGQQFSYMTVRLSEDRFLFHSS